MNTMGSTRTNEVIIAMDYCEMSNKGMYSTIATKEAQKICAFSTCVAKTHLLGWPSPKKIYVAFK